MLGWGYLAEGFSLWILSDHKFSSLNYSLSDFIIMNIIGLLQPLFQITMFLANKYSLSSQAASINNLENIVTVIADIFLFHYIFVLSDIIGKLLLFFIKTMLNMLLLIPACMNHLYINNHNDPLTSLRTSFNACF